MNNILNNTYRDKAQKRDNRVRFQGEIHKEPRVGRSFGEIKGPVVNLFLKGDTKNGHVFIPVRVAGKPAELLVEQVYDWKVGDEVMVEGEIDWESYQKDGKKNYITRINAFSVYRMETF